jgi:hypothetical protein
MTASGQKLTWWPWSLTSAIPTEADITRQSSDVRFVPTAEMRGEAKRLANLLIRQHAKEANAGD